MPQQSRFEEFLRTIPGTGSGSREVDRVQAITSRIAPHGDFEQLTGVNAIIKRILNLLLIPEGTYVFDPEFGTGIHLYLFEPVDDITYDRLRSIVKEAVDRNKADVESIDFDILFFKQKKGFRIQFFIEDNSVRREQFLDINEGLLREMNQSSSGKL